MEILWFGQSAFLLRAGTTVAIDPFGDIGARAAERGLRFAYTPIGPVAADVLLITHEHFDHNGAEVVAGDPHVIRSTRVHDLRRRRAADADNRPVRLRPE